MPSTAINDCSIYYEDVGQGPVVVLSAGGRGSVEQIHPLAEQLSKHCRVIVWDRANLGRSDVAFTGPSDLDMWAHQLAGLLERLAIKSAYVAGASSGARVSIRACLRYPDLFSGMFLWLISGRTGAEGLAKMYYGAMADIAERDGMQGVAQDSYWAQRISANPANLGRLLSQEPARFARTMRRWERAMLVDSFMMGASADDLRKIAARTAIVLTGDGHNHGRQTAEMVASLVPGAEGLDPPRFAEEWRAILDAKSYLGTGYELIPQLPGLIAEFVARTEKSKDLSKS